MMHSQLLLLGLPSLALWGLILWHRDRLQGWRVVLVSVVGVSVYAILRATAIGEVMGAMGGERPYLMRAPVLPLAASSPQEIVGWGVAIGLAWALAERAVVGFGWRATPARLTLIAFFAMTTISAAVEGAAIAGGWWRWTLPSDAVGSQWPVPAVALLDWGFVALDFLFPLLVWLARRRGWQLALALTVFPLHFLTHVAVTPLIPGVPLTGYAIGHVLLLVAMGAAAVGEQGVTRNATPREQRWWLPSALAFALALWTAAIASLHGHAPGITSLPLALLAVVLLAVEFRRSQSRAAMSGPPLSAWPLWMRRSAVLVFGSAAILAWLWPEAMRDQSLRRQVDVAVAAVGNGDLEGARLALNRAQAIEPEHSAVATLMGLVALRDARDGDAQESLDRALRVDPNSHTALQLAAVAAIRQKQSARAFMLASRGRSLYPDDLVFRYLESASSASSATGTATMIALARSTPAALSELAAVAQLIDDRAMLMACREALRENQTTGTTGTPQNN